MLPEPDTFKTRLYGEVLKLSKDRIEYTGQKNEEFYYIAAVVIIQRHQAVYFLNGRHQMLAAVAVL